MAELMLINPGRRVKKRRKKPRSAAQKAATRRMLAARFGKKRTSKRKKARTVVMAKKKRKYAKRRAASGYTVGRARVRRRKLNPIRAHRRRRYRHNPMGRIGSVGSFAKRTLMPSAVGAAGALGVNVLLGYLPIPPQFKTGPMLAVVKIAGALGVGMLASKMVSRDTAHQIAAGAITVTMYDLLKGYLQQAAPQLPMLSEVDMMEEYPNLSYAGAGYTVPDMGAYVSGDDMGAYVSDGPVTNMSDAY